MSVKSAFFLQVCGTIKEPFALLTTCFHLGDFLKLWSPRNPEYLYGDLERSGKHIGTPFCALQSNTTILRIEQVSVKLLFMNVRMKLYILRRLCMSWEHPRLHGSGQLVNVGAGKNNWQLSKRTATTWLCSSLLQRYYLHEQTGRMATYGPAYHIPDMCNSGIA